MWTPAEYLFTNNVCSAFFVKEESLRNGLSNGEDLSKETMGFVKFTPGLIRCIKNFIIKTFLRVSNVFLKSPKTKKVFV